MRQLKTDVKLVNPRGPPSRIGPHSEGRLRLALREGEREKGHERRQIRSFRIDIREADERPSYVGLGRKRGLRFEEGRILNEFKISNR